VSSYVQNRDSQLAKQSPSRYFVPEHPHPTSLIPMIGLLLKFHSRRCPPTGAGIHSLSPSFVHSKERARGKGRNHMSHIAHLSCISHLSFFFHPFLTTVNYRTVLCTCIPSICYKISKRQKGAGRGGEGRGGGGGIDGKRNGNIEKAITARRKLYPNH